MDNVSMYMAALTGEYSGVLPQPRPIRFEMYLAAILGLIPNTDLPVPREIPIEKYAYDLAVNGLGGGGSGELPEMSDPAAANQILYGKQVINSAGRITTGAMPDRGELMKTLTAELVSIAIAEGYYSGGTVNVDVESKTVAPGTVEQIVEPSEGKLLKRVTVGAVESQEKTVSPSAEALEVVPDDGKVLSKVTVKAVATQTKSVNPTTSAQDVTPDSGKFLSKVSVGAVQTQEKTVTPTTSVQEVKPDSGKFLSKVIVKAAEGGGESGGVELPELTNPASPEHTLADYEYIDQNGVKQTGTMPNNKAESALLTPDDDTYNIPSGYNPGGGVIAVATENVEATPSGVQQVINAQNAFIKRVTIGAVETQEKTVKPTNSEQVVEPDDGKFLSKVVVGAAEGGGGSDCVITDARALFWMGSRADVFDKMTFGKVKSCQQMFYNYNAVNNGAVSFDFANVDTSECETFMFAFDGATVVEEILNIHLSNKISCKNSTGLGVFPCGTSASKRAALRRLTFRDPTFQNLHEASIAYCNFNREAMVEMFSTLPLAVTTGTYRDTAFNITGNPCVTDGTLTDDDRAIATSKGWTLVE